MIAKIQIRPPLRKGRLHRVASLAAEFVIKGSAMRKRETDWPMRPRNKGRLAAKAKAPIGCSSATTNDD
jgi:hypothetical protein